MSDIHKIILTKNCVRITSDLCPNSDIFSKLVADGVLSLDEVEIIQNGDIRRDRAFKMVEILYRKGFEGFKIFLESLRSTHKELCLFLQDQLQRFENDPTGPMDECKYD